MTLTPTGRLLLDVARNWRLGNARLWSAIQADRGVEHDHIRIAAMDSMVNGFVLKLVQKIARLYPWINVDIQITNPDSAAKVVVNGEFDPAAVANVATRDNLKFHWQREFPLGYIGRRSIRLQRWIDSASLNLFPIRSRFKARHCRYNSFSSQGTVGFLIGQLNM